MKVLKPFNRDGKQYPRGSAAPSNLDKATIAHYRRHGMISGEDAKSTEPASTTQSTGPARRGRPPGPSETKPAGPSETKPVAPTSDTSTAGVVAATSTTGITSDSFKPTTDVVGDDRVRQDDGTSENPTLPLGA